MQRIEIGAFHVCTHQGNNDFFQGYKAALERLRMTCVIDQVDEGDVYAFMDATMNDACMSKAFRAGMVAGYVAGLHMGPPSCLPSERRAAQIERHSRRAREPQRERKDLQRCKSVRRSSSKRQA